MHANPVCVHCKGTLHKGTAPFSVDRNGYHIHWDALPAWVCDQCGEPLFEAAEVDRIQRALASFSPAEWEMYERAKMAEQDARGALAVAHQEGKEQGLVDGKRDLLLRLLARAQITLTDHDRARIQACADPMTLDRWAENVLGAKSAADVLT